MLVSAIHQQESAITYVPSHSHPPHLSRLSQSTGLISLSHTAHSAWLPILHMAMGMFLWYSLNSPHPLLPTLCPQSVLSTSASHFWWNQCQQRKVSPRSSRKNAKVKGRAEGQLRLQPDQHGKLWAFPGSDLWLYCLWSEQRATAMLRVPSCPPSFIESILIDPELKCLLALNITRGRYDFGLGCALPAPSSSH